MIYQTGQGTTLSQVACDVAVMFNERLDLPSIAVAGSVFAIQQMRELVVNPPQTMTALTCRYVALGLSFGTATAAVGLMMLKNICENSDNN